VQEAVLKSHLTSLSCEGQHAVVKVPRTGNLYAMSVICLKLEAICLAQTFRTGDIQLFLLDIIFTHSRW
jgi:hypothetical protein